MRYIKKKEEAIISILTIYMRDNPRNLFRGMFCKKSYVKSVDISHQKFKRTNTNIKIDVVLS